MIILEKFTTSWDSEIVINDRPADIDFRYRALIAHRIFWFFPTVTEVWIIKRGGPIRPIFDKRNPQPDHIAMYILSSRHGGRPSEFRITLHARQTQRENPYPVACD
jgi:hypothetical protein